MKSLFVFIGLLLLAALAGDAIARKDPGEYWQNVMKDEPMPEFIQGLVGASKVTCTDNNNHKKNKGHFHTLSSEKTSLDPFPSATAYTDDVKPEDDKLFTKEFEPGPNISAYTDDVKQEGEKYFTKEFEPSPNVSAYTDDVKPDGEKFFTKEFEPSPNVSAYSDGADPEGEKSFTKEFEPSPNISAYTDGIIELKAEN